MQFYSSPKFESVFTVCRSKSRVLNELIKLAIQLWQNTHHEHQNVSESCGENQFRPDLQDFEHCKMAGLEQWELLNSNCGLISYYSTVTCILFIYLFFLPWENKIVCNRCVTRYSKTQVWCTGELTGLTIVTSLYCKNTWHLYIISFPDLADGWAEGEILSNPICTTWLPVRNATGELKAHARDISQKCQSNE